MKIFARRPKVALHRLRACDAAAWRALRLEALALHPEADAASHDEWAGRPLGDFAARLEEGTVLGALALGALVGSAALDPEGPDAGRISSVYVRPELRGQGIARRLILRACDLAAATGMVRLTLSVASCNAPARALYAGLGFCATGQGARALCRDGRLVDEVVMSRSLGA